MARKKKKIDEERTHRKFKEKGGFELDLRMKREAITDPFTEVPPAEEMTVFLRQHVGPEAKPLIQEGDFVEYGEKIGGIEEDEEWGVPVHSPVNGIVKEIKMMEHPVSGDEERIVVIETEDEETKPYYDPLDPKDVTKDELLERIKEAGIVGLGGAICPTNVKLSYAKDKVSHLIINAKESDPNIACDVRLISERAEEMIDGIKLMAYIIGADNIVFATRTQEGELPEFENLLKREKNIDIVRVRPNYSIGYGRLLITEILGKEIPQDTHSYDMGALVHNVGTAYAVYKAIREGEPLVSRGITYYSKDIGGRNLWVRIGTPVKHIMDFVDAPAIDFERVALGSIMMGPAISDPSIPITKADSGVTGFTEKEPHPYEDKTWCIRCGYCNEVCPMDLYPQLIMKAEKKGDKKRLRQLNTDVCIDCGLCSFVCPARINYRPILSRAKSEM